MHYSVHWLLCNSGWAEGCLHAKQTDVFYGRHYEHVDWLQLEEVGDGVGIKVSEALSTTYSLEGVDIYTESDYYEELLTCYTS